MKLSYLSPVAILAGSLALTACGGGAAGGGSADIYVSDVEMYLPTDCDADAGLYASSDYPFQVVYGVQYTQDGSSLHHVKLSAKNKNHLHANGKLGDDPASMVNMWQQALNGGTFSSIQFAVGDGVDASGNALYDGQSHYSCVGYNSQEIPLTFSLYSVDPSTGELGQQISSDTNLYSDFSGIIGVVGNELNQKPNANDVYLYDPKAAPFKNKHAVLGSKYKLKD